MRRMWPFEETNDNSKSDAKDPQGSNGTTFATVDAQDPPGNDITDTPEENEGSTNEVTEQMGGITMSNDE